MKIIFLKSFLDDIKKIKDKNLKAKIKAAILSIEETLEDLSHVKKMKGYSIAYRMRIGDYRMGFYKETEVAEIARFLNEMIFTKYSQKNLKN